MKTNRILKRAIAGVVLLSGGTIAVGGLGAQVPPRRTNRITWCPGNPVMNYPDGAGPAIVGHEYLTHLGLGVPQGKGNVPYQRHDMPSTLWDET